MKYHYHQAMEISIDDIRKLPPDKQLSIAEQIWDGLLDSGALAQGWQVEEVRRRAAELDDNPALAITSEQLWAAVDLRRNG